MARQKTKTDTIRLQTDILSGISVEIPAGISNGYKVKTTSLLSCDYHFCCRAGIAQLQKSTPSI